MGTRQLILVDMKHLEKDISTNSILVLLLCGIPGAGKSSVADAFVTDCPIPAERVEYDGIEDGFVSAVPIILTPLTSETASTTVDIRLEAWRRTRKVALERLKEILTRKLRNTGETVVPAATENSTCELTKVIVMDDNFYLRSMRKQVFLTCQEVLAMNPTISLYMATVFVDAPTDVCLARNASRSALRRLPPEVIQRMAQQIEIPQQYFVQDDESLGPKRSFHWEKVVWRIDGSLPVQSNLQILLDHLQATQQWKELAAIPAPIDPQIELDRLSEERKRTKESTRHQIDVALRQAVKCVAQTNPGLARAANMARKQTLGDTTIDSAHGARQAFCDIFFSMTVLDTTQRQNLQMSLLNSI